MRHGHGNGDIKKQNKERIISSHLIPHKQNVLMKWDFETGNEYLCLKYDSIQSNRLPSRLQFIFSNLKYLLKGE